MIYVIDTSVVLAILFDEPGSKEASKVIAGSLMSSVNLSEVLTKCIENAASAEFAETQVLRLGVELVPFTAEDAMAAAKLRPLTRHRGLSMGDRACLALALRYNQPVLTADRQWAELDVDVDVCLIR